MATLPPAPVPGAGRGFDPVRTMFVFDGHRWAAAAPLPQAVHTEGLVAYRGELWSIGGFDHNGNAVRSVWIYSPKTDSWRAGPRLARPVAMVGATAAGDEVYAVSETVFERYLPGTGWVLGQRLEVPRHALGLFAVDQRLFAARRGRRRQRPHRVVSCCRGQFLQPPGYLPADLSAAPVPKLRSSR